VSVVGPNPELSCVPTGSSTPTNARVPGYSDRINHALAFAAKHHDQEVRKGTRAPYRTQAANVAVILARYDRDDDTLVAAILHDAIEHSLRTGARVQDLTERLTAKFGERSLELALSVVLKGSDEHGIDLSLAESRADQLQRIGEASEPAQWVSAAVTLHHAAALAADLRRTVDADAVWSRAPGGRSGALAHYTAVVDRLRMSGFGGAILGELTLVLADLDKRARTEVGAENAGQLP
jgi:hypothetical protein